MTEQDFRELVRLRKEVYKARYDLNIELDKMYDNLFAGELETRYRAAQCYLEQYHSLIAKLIDIGGAHAQESK